MAELKWEDGCLCMFALSAHKSHGRLSVWRIESNGGLISIDNSSCDLLDVMPPDKDGDKLFKYLDISKAIAACQAAEDKLCDVWPKYYDCSDYYTATCDDRFAFFKAHSARRVDAIQVNGVSRRYSIHDLVFSEARISKTVALSRLDENKWPKYTESIGFAVFNKWVSETEGYYILADGIEHFKGNTTKYGDRPRTIISETIALSRLEKPMYEGKKLVLDVAQIGNVVVVKILKMDESLKNDTTLATVDGFALRSETYLDLENHRLDVWGDKYKGAHSYRSVVACTFDSAGDAAKVVKQIQACVTIINAESKPAAVEPSKSIEFKTIC